MYVGRDYDVANSAESDVFSMDFVGQLPSGDSLLTASCALAVVQGVDDNPNSHLSGSAGITGTNAMQRIITLNAGVVYRVTFTVTTALGNTIELYSRICCTAVP